ncbi:MAG: FAD-dependent oxidoreductase [Rhodospirillaceae bacterium]|nr:FAD-dependent oxidoreductase [Rhodospirillaceae bacterium]
MAASETRLDTLLDVMRVPVDGDPSEAVIRVAGLDAATEIACDVLVVGGGTGGVAAALAAARRGRRVCLIEETDWIGGQLTAQGVSALDEHEHIERFGGTASYYRLRAMLRDHYRPAAGDAGRSPAFNPGDCWVTRVAFEPRVAVAAMEAMLKPYVERGTLSVHRRHKAAAAAVDGDRIVSITAVSLEGEEPKRFRPRIVLDATELGDLLPLTGAEYRSGAETIAETGEEHAQPKEAKAHCVQSFTYTFGMERRPEDERHAIPTPERYAYFRERQPYSLRIHVHGGEIYGEESGWLAYKVFDTMPGTKGGLWTYRRLVAAAQFDRTYLADLTMFNWPGNDYRDAGLIDRPPLDVARALQDAKRASLGFLHWVQTEAPATGDRLGASELKLRPDIMGTGDGLAKFPYIRESRRIRAIKTVVEREVSTAFQPGPRAQHFIDSVGIGWYPIDIHNSGPDDVGVSCRTRPFQIPLGALLPIRLTNLIAAAKNIGTTHITNGCYRLHPVEWNIGEAAGALAAFALDHDLTPRKVHADPARLGAFQASLLGEGVPLAWIVDVPVDHPSFAPVQRLFMSGRMAPDEGLAFRPAEPPSAEDWERWGGKGEPPFTRAAAAEWLFGR